MMEFMLKAKLHRAVITQADLHYEGSISIDYKLMQAAGIREFEKVHIYNINNGERFETYAIKGEENSGIIGLNGAAARKGAVGDRIIIVTYCLVDKSEQEVFSPTIVLLNEDNNIDRIV